MEADVFQRNRTKNIQKRSLKKPPYATAVWVFPKIGVPPKWMAYNAKPY